MANKIIIYDDTCPMCAWYTGAFVRTGLLQPAERRRFAGLDRSKQELPVDWERSRDEIPLLDLDAGTTRYGIDSMLAIIGQQYPLIAKVANWTPLRWSLHLLYKLITYNRRAISGAYIPASAREYGPHFNFFYRYLYVLLVILFFSMTVCGLSLSSILRWAIFCCGMIPFLVFAWWPHRRALHIVGTMLTALIPVTLLLWVASYWPLSWPYFGLLAAGTWTWMSWRRWRVLRVNLTI